MDNDARRAMAVVNARSIVRGVIEVDGSRHGGNVPALREFAQPGTFGRTMKRDYDVRNQDSKHCGRREYGTVAMNGTNIRRDMPKWHRTGKMIQSEDCIAMTVIRTVRTSATSEIDNSFFVES
jgi:hypothetical protein